MSYIKAVTTSKQKPEANTDTKPGKNKTQVSNNSEQHRVQNDLHCLHMEQENDKPEHEKVVHTLTERNEVCLSVNLSLVHVFVSHTHTHYITNVVAGGYCQTVEDGQEFAGCF